LLYKNAVYGTLHELLSSIVSTFSRKYTSTFPEVSTLIFILFDDTFGIIW
jgi:hypothetical protein